VQADFLGEGKRNAARTTNSGQPVDDSGPGLRVGPTNPVTADLNSAACPPAPPFASSRSDISQHKSRRESESGALSGASAASDMLRSEATQRVSSLDEVQNNRNTYESIFVNTASGRGKSCGRFTIVGIVDGVQRFIRLDCKCWDCKYCGPKKARRYKNAIRDTAEAHKLCRFLTLTLDP
jgi:hypothetical protein